MNKNVTIKILGDETQVLETLKKIEALFPVYVEGKLNPNDAGNGVHVFLTVPAPLEALAK